MLATNIRPGDVVQPGGKVVSAVLLEPGETTIIYEDYALDAYDFVCVDGNEEVDIENNWPKSGLAEPLIRVESGTSTLTPNGRLDGTILAWIGDDEDGHPLYAPIDKPTMMYDRRNERIFEYTVLDVVERS